MYIVLLFDFLLIYSMYSINWFDSYVQVSMVPIIILLGMMQQSQNSFSLFAGNRTERYIKEELIRGN